MTIHEILVDLRYRGDYTPRSTLSLQHHVARNDLVRFTEEMDNRDRWLNVPSDRFMQRAAFFAEMRWTALNFLAMGHSSRTSI